MYARRTHDHAHTHARPHVHARTHAHARPKSEYHVHIRSQHPTHDRTHSYPHLSSDHVYIRSNDMYFAISRYLLGYIKTKKVWVPSTNIQGPKSQRVPSLYT